MCVALVLRGSEYERVDFFFNAYVLRGRYSYVILLYFYLLFCSCFTNIDGL